MANTNQILPFATGGGANVMAFADYSALPARSAGFVAGVAQSVQLNTAWRQASFVASMIAQFTADYGPSNVNDDGNIVNLEAQFVAALQDFYPSPASLLHYGIAAGSANAITVTVAPAITSLVPGTTLLIKAALTNTGAATINANGLGVVAITHPDGAALDYGDIENGEIAIMIYDGVEFQLASSMYLGNELDHYGVDGGAVNAIVVPTLTPPLLVYAPGTTLKVKVANTNTGGVTINAVSLGAKVVLNPAGGALIGGELILGQVATFIYDGVQFYLQSAQATNTNTATGGLTTVATTSPIYGNGTGAAPVAIFAASTTDSGAVQLALANDYTSDVVGHALTPDIVWTAAAFLSLVYAASLTLDFSTGFNWNIGTLTGNVTLNNPVNLKSGQEGLIILTQDATGGRTLTLGSAWKTAGGFSGLSIPGNAMDAIAYKAVSATLIVYTLIKGLA